jgi:hypothetical protein
MPNTTNFNWVTPADTDLVKDGAAAIRTLGNGIDTSFLDLKGGTTGQVLSKNSNTDLDFTWVAQDDSNAIQNDIVDAKGDLISATAADTPARLAVGANNTVLTADSSTATGLKWAAPSSGGMTLLSTTTASASSTITLSSISQDYIHLQIILDNITVSTDTVIRMRFNGDSGANRYRNLLDPLDFNNTFDSDFMRASGTFDSSVAESCSIVDIPRYTNTYSRKYAQYNFFGVNNSTTTNGQVEGFGNLYNQTPAITSITLYPATGTFSGTILLYGVK